MVTDYCRGGELFFHLKKVRTLEVLHTVLLLYFSLHVAGLRYATPRRFQHPFAEPRVPRAPRALLRRRACVSLGSLTLARHCVQVRPE